jgi:hypothetical protein
MTRPSGSRASGQGFGRLWLPLFFRMLFNVCFLIGLMPATSAKAQDRVLPPVEEWYTLSPERAAFSWNVGKLFWAGRFEELDRLADNYLRTDSRWRDGVPERRHLFNAINAVSYDKDEPSRKLEHAINMTRIWMAQRPDSHSAKLHHAEFVRAKSWLLRSSAFANELSIKQVRDFTRHITEAYEHLKAAETIAAHDPHWHMLMIGVLTDLGADRKDIFEMFRRGTTQFPTYEGIYYAMTRTTLDQWGGSREERRSIVQAAVEKTGPGFGKAFVGRIYMTALDLMSSKSFFDTFEWSEVKDALEDLLYRYPTISGLNSSAQLACAAHDFSMTRKLFDITVARKDADDEDSWRTEEWRNSCFLNARTAPAGNPIKPSTQSAAPAKKD